MKKALFSLLLFSCLPGLTKTTMGAKKEDNSSTKINWLPISDHTFDLGLEAGPSVISLYGNSFTNEHNKPACGFSTAITFQYNFQKILSLRTDIAFERKGSLFPYNFIATDQNGSNIGSVILKESNNYDYLTIPLLLRATFGDKIKIFVNAGPYLGALLQSKTITRSNGGEMYGFPAKTVANESHNLNRFDIGITTGVGLQLPLNEGFAISFEVRNNSGLYNITKQFPGSIALKNNSTNFLFGFSYAFGKRKK